MNKSQNIIKEVDDLLNKNAIPKVPQSAPAKLNPLLKTTVAKNPNITKPDPSKQIPNNVNIVPTVDTSPVSNSNMNGPSDYESETGDGDG